MHYKNGRLAKDGDPVICKGYNGLITVGKVYNLTPGTETCNCSVAEPVMGGVNQLTCRTLNEMYHAEDALTAIENENSKPQVENFENTVSTCGCQSKE